MYVCIYIYYIYYILLLQPKTTALLPRKFSLDDNSEVSDCFKDQSIPPPTIYLH